MKFRTLKAIRVRKLAREIKKRRLTKTMGWVIFGLIIALIFASLIGCVGFHG